MKERPILFSAPMVRALRAGTKTQTRRALKAQPTEVSKHGAQWFLTYGNHGAGERIEYRCPYGSTGDRLWTREAWAQNENQLSDTRIDWSIVYRADGGPRALDNGSEKPWRPSIHMPRRCSRNTLEVTEVRVERLQDISEADAIAEGGEPRQVEEDGSVIQGQWREGYRVLWESINGPGSWDANPWVWAVSFKVLPCSD